MVPLLRRQFVVRVPLAVAWDRLARIAEWPSWARHIRRIDLDPPGPVTPGSKGRIRLRNGIRSAFRVTEHEPYRHWAWTGPFLGLAVRYDHRFEPVDERSTRLVWIVEAEGFGVTALGRLFAAVYARSLDRAIPRLVAEMEGADS